MKKKEILHEGIVAEVGSEFIKVVIKSNSACGGCHAKAQCGMSESVDKNIDLHTKDYPNVKVGDTVQVVISMDEGVFAVVLAYLVPIIIIIVSLVIFDYFKVNELLSFFVTIALVGIYYTVLYLLRSKIDKKIKIKLNLN